jgi:hypothetical protein
MDEKTAVVGRHLRWIHEFLFSLNLGWIAVWHERMSRSTPLYPLPVVRYLYWHTHFVEPQTVIEQVCWSIIVGVSVFALFRLLSRLWLTEALMRTVAGAVALAGFPFFALTDRFAHLAPLRIEAYAFFLVFETLVVLLCAIFYYLRKWPLPAGPSVILLFLHFSLWAWATGSWVNPLQEVRGYGFGGVGIWISTLFHFGFPLMGFLSSLTWARYLNCGRAHSKADDSASQAVAHL